MTWSELVEKLGKCPKIHSATLKGTYKLMENDKEFEICAFPYGVQAKTEDEAKQGLVTAITNHVGDLSDVDIWVRVMPEVQETSDPEGYLSYARIAFAPKGVLCL